MRIEWSDSSEAGYELKYNLVFIFRIFCRFVKNP